MIRLLVVDDSALMRRLLGELFEAEGDFELAFARDGAEALDLLDRFRPDVVTLDVQMPHMDGLTCLDRIMIERPTPVVMVSALTTQGAEQTIQALELGAVDVASKPGGAISLRMDELGPPLVDKVRLAATARLPKARRLAERVRARSGSLPRPSPPAPSPVARPRPRRRPILPLDVDPGRDPGLVLVGTSTGGPAALDALLEPLPAEFPWPILVAQHMPATFTGALARRLDGMTALSVVEVSRPMQLEPGRVYIARGDADVVLSPRPGGLFAVPVPADPAYRWHPSVDRMVDSALSLMTPARMVGVLMTGMGNDGAAAMTRLRRAGGRTIAESEESAVIWGMPGELVRADGAEAIVPLDAIAARLASMVARA